MPPSSLFRLAKSPVQIGLSRCPASEHESLHLTGVRILPRAYLSLSDRIANPGKIFANVAFDRRL